MARNGRGPCRFFFFFFLSRGTNREKIDDCMTEGDNLMSVVFSASFASDLL